MRLHVVASLAGFFRLVAGYWIIACVVACPLFANPAREGAYGAEAVRAVMLFNFVRFTDWPGSAMAKDDPFVIGVAGDRTLEDELFKLAERQTIRDRRVRVVRVNNLRSLAGCHALYVGPAVRLDEAGAPGADEFLREIGNQPVLTVSDSPTFLAQGGIINVYVGDEGKLRFEIAPKHAADAGLVLSSRLLALARIVDVPTSAPTP
jgi:hypothetical protein